MALVGIIGIALLGLVIFGPQLWVKAVIERHGSERSDFPGTGGELAQHLAERFELAGLDVETTDKGDHFDPEANVVRLLEKHSNGRSVTAIAIAAHEIGHAIQHHRGERLLSTRQKLVKFAASADVAASIFFFAAPVLAVFAKTPIAFFSLLGIGILFLGIRILVHLVTLPVEWDASFNKALPILQQGGYLKPEDMPAARQVLRAAALTYLAAALVSLLDLARWIRIIR